MTKVKHGGWSVNVVNENPQITPLPHGLKTENTLSQLSPGSNRILVAMSNYSDKDITIPAKTIISQLSLGNKIPKMIHPGDEKDSELLDKDEGLKYEHFEQHKLISEELKLEPKEYIPTSCDKTCDQSHTVEIEDLGPDLEEDIEFQNSYTDNDKPNLGKSDQPTSSEEDDGSWILKLIDLSGLEKWSDEDKNAAIEMIKRCLKRKSTPQVAPLQPILVSQPLELVHLDYLSLEPSKGNIENVLVITDHFTRYALAYASKTQTAQATARILWDNFICHYGFPEQFISDQGRNFESDLIKELCKIAGVKKLHTTPYHPQSNGQCERFNSTLCNMFGTLSDEEKSDWKSHLGCMTHAYNCTKHASTTYSPYYLMFGRHPRLPIDVVFGLHKPNCSDNCSKSRYIQKLRRRLNYAHKKASKYSSEQAQKYKTSYDKSVKGPQLQVNDLVLVKIVAHKARHKIQDKWESEEYIVIEQLIPGTPVYRFRQVTGTKVRTLHRNLLLPLGVKYQPDIDSDESDSDDSVCVDTSHSRSHQPEKVSQAKSVRFQSA